MLSIYVSFASPRYLALGSQNRVRIKWHFIRFPPSKGTCNSYRPYEYPGVVGGELFNLDNFKLSRFNTSRTEKIHIEAS